MLNVLIIFNITAEALGALNRFNGDADRAAEWIFTADGSKIADMLHTDPIVRPAPRSLYSDEQDGTQIEMRNMGTSVANTISVSNSFKNDMDEEETDQIELFSGIDLRLVVMHGFFIAFFLFLDLGFNNARIL